MKANTLILMCSLLVLFASLGLSEDLGSVRGEVTSIDLSARTIKIGDQVIQAPKTEFGVVPIGVGDQYRVLDSGHPAEVEVGDKVEIQYVINRYGEKLLSNMINYSRSGTEPVQEDDELGSRRVDSRESL
jgi:hypothetical protein